MSEHCGIRGLFGNKWKSTIDGSLPVVKNGKVTWYRACVEKWKNPKFNALPLMSTKGKALPVVRHGRALWVGQRPL